MNKLFYLGINGWYKFNEAEFNQAIKDYKRMIDIFIYLINAIKDNEIRDEDWRYFAEKLAIKFTFGSNSICALINGNQVESELAKVKARIIDISSLYVLMRMQIENYLTYYYLFVDPANIDIQRLRFRIYELSGYESRQKFEPLTAEASKKQEEERVRINEIRNELVKNELFEKLDKKEKDLVLRWKKAKLIGWNDLLIESDLYNEVFQKAWHLYSNFAHSEFASLIQVQEFLKNPKDTIEFRNLSMITLLMLTSKYIKTFCELYREIQIRYDLIPISDQETINFFSEMARNRYKTS